VRYELLAQTHVIDAPADIALAEATPLAPPTVLGAVEIPVAVDEAAPQVIVERSSGRNPLVVWFGLGVRETDLAMDGIEVAEDDERFVSALAVAVAVDNRPTTMVRIALTSPFLGW
jgi:hypothetical protein